MLTREIIKKALITQCKVTDHSPILVTVSGGADSMALLHIMHSLNYDVIAAHCNFHLRDKESDEDEAFVAQYCTLHQIPFHIKHFNTKEFASSNGISIEMAARDLRYEWFHQLAHDFNCISIATAHHANDNIETFMLNIARGTGIRGLTGMAFRTGLIIRPLLNTTRIEIENYCQENKIAWRNDSSNDSHEYTRNKIRHQIIPIFNEINPSFTTTMHHTFERMQELEMMLLKQVEQFASEHVVEEGNTQLIPIKSLIEHQQQNLILFEILRNKGFNSAQINDIIVSLNGMPGKQFLSSTHRLIRDRHNLIVTPIEKSTKKTYTINIDDSAIEKPIKLSFSTFDRNPEFRFSTNPHCVHFDSDKVDFPLTLRHWQQGDVFMPLGMNHFKKISDYFIDEKMSLNDKENAWLLLSGEDIVWVIGKRSDNRYKITNQTRTILEIKIE